MRMLVWLLVTCGLGTRSLWRLCRFLIFRHHILAPVQRCARGHEVITEGVWVCAACKSTYEGSAWESCPVCRSRAGWVACPTCALAVRDPLR